MMETDTDMDFPNTAKNVLRLVKAKLACGAESDAIEIIRGVLVEANRLGMRKALKSEGVI